MDMKPVAQFFASDLKKSAPVLDAAMQGLVVIKRRNEQFVLLRQTQLDQMMEEAADPRPKCLEDLLVDYDAVKIKQLLAAWDNDPPAGSEIL